MEHVAGFPVVTSDDAPPPPAVLERAQALGSSIIRAADAREQIVDDLKLDKQFSLPGANWRPAQGNDYWLLFRLMRSLRWEQIRELRLRCGVFTGHLLTDLPTVAGMSSVAPIKPNFYRDWDRSYVKASTVHWHFLADEMPEDLLFQPPLVLGECGWRVGEKLVSPDVVSMQEYINLMYEAGIFEHCCSNPRVLEIGGGYGGLALALQRILKPRQYVICDLPESLLMSGLYLFFAQQVPVRLLQETDGSADENAGELLLVPNYLFGRLAGEFDLIVNTLSMSEMTAHQASTYGAGLSRLLHPRGLFYEQNYDNRHIGFIYCKEYLAPHFAFEVDLSTSTKYPLTHGIPHVRSHFKFDRRNPMEFAGAAPR